MSTKAQTILDEIRTLPRQEILIVAQEVQRLLKSPQPSAKAADPIRSARGMFSGSHLADALKASRAEERRRG